MISSAAVRIEAVVKEGKGITTLRFGHSIDARPGQFLMVWIPGVDEIPMSVSYMGEIGGITVKEIGEATRALSNMKEGDHLGIRGPYGNGFQMPEGRILCVGGGVGLPPLLTAAESLADKGRIDIVIGARTAEEVIFQTRAKACSNDVRISTDDGTMGCKGTAVALASQMMREKSYQMVLGCGPEIMNKFLLKACQENGVRCQLSLERLMKCGAGLCGSCVIDGQRVCSEGPVFDGETLASMSEFGRFRRDEKGSRTKC